MQITIILNPVKLIAKNKLEVIKQEHIEEVKKIFTEEVQRIHTSLPRLEHYLSQEISYQQLEYYYNKTIGAGDYYKLSEAIKKVQESNYTSKTKEKIIEVLKLVNKCRSIWKAREESQYNSSYFNRYLKQIRALGINPVTIPSS